MKIAKIFDWELVLQTGDNTVNNRSISASDNNIVNIHQAIKPGRAMVVNGKASIGFGGSEAENSQGMR